MVEFAGYHMPVQFEGIMAEHLWVRAHAGLFDVSHMGQLRLTGEGVEGALEALLPADITGHPFHKARYSLLLDEGGGILDDLMLTREAKGSVYMVVNGATKWDDIAHMRMELPDEITLNHLEDQALLAVQGPEAATALERVVPGVSDLVFMQGKAFAWERRDLWISRSGYTGEDGFEISVPADDGGGASPICDVRRSPEVKPIGLGARDSLRLEADLPLYGHDLDTDTTPVMADARLCALAASGGARKPVFRVHERILAGARGWPGRETRRLAGRGQATGARGCRRRRCRGVGCRQGDLRRLRAQRRRADRDGLCARRNGRAGHCRHAGPARQDPPGDGHANAFPTPPLLPREQVR